MDKPNISLPKTAPVQYIREVITELKKVTWPTRQETIKLTVVVLAISIAVGVFIGGFDALILRITSLLLTR